MTNQEAIEIITNAVQTENMTIEQDKALAIVQEALEKFEQEQEINASLRTQLKTAQKTIEHLRNEIKNISEKQILKKVIAETKNDREFIDYVCPNCKTTLQQKNKQAKRVTIYKYKHCIDCGQALDWSE